MREGSKMKLPRRKFLHLAAGAAALPVLSRFAWAQAYPSRPARLLVGFPAGGVTDVFCTTNGSMALGAPRSSLCYRESDGCCEQPCRRGARIARWLYPPPASRKACRTTRSRGLTRNRVPRFNSGRDLQQNQWLRSRGSRPKAARCKSLVMNPNFADGL